MPSTCYIGGPMTGHPHFNFPAFDRAADLLRSWGWIVYSPAEYDREGGVDPTRYPTGDLAQLRADGFDLKAAFRWDLDRLFEVDAIVLLPGYSASKGVGAELAVAQIIGLQVGYIDGDSLAWA